VVKRGAVTSPTGTQAVDRAARLLTEVVHSPGSVTFTELAAATGLAKSTTSRLLLALERGGLVRRDGAGRFRPGEVFVRYAWRGGAEAGLVDVAQPFLDQLGAATGETVNLGVGRDGMVEQIAQVDSTYLIGGTNWLGRPVPLHCAALGKVLLAYGAAELPPGRLERRTSRTITSRAELDANLAEARERGYAITDEELEPGLVAVAAPVCRDGGAVVAALSVSAPATRLTPARLAGVAAQCVAQAAAVSAALGHRPPAAGTPAAGTPAAGTSAAQIPANPQKEGAA
jgi:IclR family acetate operon transcriptional repressor